MRARAEHPEQPAAFASSLDLSLYADNIVHHGDFEDTLRRVSAYEPVAVMAGHEFGVEFADRLSEALGLPTNGTALSKARRDKFTMIETIKAAGLRGARQLLATSAGELEAWHQEHGGRVVVKPLSSAGNDGIRFCDTPQDSAAAFRELTGADNLFSQRNEGVVAQEYLYGGEYMVNTVSRDGRHHVTDIIATTRISVNGVHDISNSVYLLPRRGDVQDRLVPYALSVLDALGVRHGPAHTELKLTPEGPVLIETGARICGGDLPYYVRHATGESPSTGPSTPTSGPSVSRPGTPRTTRSSSTSPPSAWSPRRPAGSPDCATSRTSRSWRASTTSPSSSPSAARSCPPPTTSPTSASSGSSTRWRRS